MNKMTQEEIKNVLEAYYIHQKTIRMNIDEHTQIEYSFNDRKVDVWDFDNYTYTVKPEPKYRPYENIEEFKDGLKHGPYLRYDYNNNENNLILPTNVFYDGNEKSYVIQMPKMPDANFQTLFDLFTWMDGTKCGVLID